MIHQKVRNPYLHRLLQSVYYPGSIVFILPCNGAAVLGPVQCFLRHPSDNRSNNKLAEIESGNNRGIINNRGNAVVPVTGICVIFCPTGQTEQRKRRNQQSRCKKCGFRSFRKFHFYSISIHFFLHSARIAAGAHNQQKRLFYRKIIHGGKN